VRLFRRSIRPHEQPIMFNKLKSTVGDLASKAGDLKSLGADAIASTAAEFNAVKPLFARVGYRVGKVQIEIGLTPKINFRLRHEADTDAGAFDELLEEHKGNRVLVAIVSALRQASVLQSKVKFQGMRFADVEVELGIPPAIKLAFVEDRPEPEPAAERQSFVVERVVVEAPAGEKAAVTPEPPAQVPSPREQPPAADAAADDPEERERQRQEDLDALVVAGIAVRFECVGCGKVLVARAKYAGREGECRRCGTLHLIPEPEGIDVRPPGEQR
jgi:hypothetical protein